MRNLLITRFPIRRRSASSGHRRSNNWSSARGTARPDRAATIRHGVLSSSERLMRILRSIVEPTADFVQLSSCPDAQPIQSGVPCRHKARLQAETLCCLDRVARSRGIDRRSRDGGRPVCRRASVALTPPRRRVMRRFDRPTLLRAARRDRRVPSGRALPERVRRRLRAYSRRTSRTPHRRLRRA
jgi:hypothetical protein